MAISIGSAVGAGFGLIGRRPVSVIAWGFFSYLATFVLVLIGLAIVGLPIIPKLLALQGQALSDPSEAAQLAPQILIAMVPALLVVVVGSLFLHPLDAHERAFQWRHAGDPPGAFRRGLS